MKIEVSVFDFVFTPTFTNFFENQEMVQEVKEWFVTDFEKWYEFQRLMEDSKILDVSSWEENFQECYDIVKEEA